MLKGASVIFSQKGRQPSESTFVLFTDMVIGHVGFNFLAGYGGGPRALFFSPQFFPQPVGSKLSALRAEVHVHHGLRFEKRF